jgi:UDP-N-acetylmuramoylalanine--D-glutamate ligase
MTCLVLGAGVSGFGVCRLLALREKEFYITDDRSVGAKFSEIKGCKALTVAEAHTKLQTSISTLVLSPTVPKTHPLVMEARAKKIPTYSEVEWSLLSYQGPVFGITGTNGKSTTVAMVEHLFQKNGVKAQACGNIGIPLSLLLADSIPMEAAILELSSFQLEQTQKLALTGGLFFNFSPDHLEQHGDVKSYFSAKWKITSFTPKDRMILHPKIGDQARLFGLPVDDSHRILSLTDSFSEKTGFLAQHNRENGFFAASLVGQFLGKPAEDFIQDLESFQTLPHRLEGVGTIAGMPIINDSKATNVASTLTALEAMETPVILALGGYDKGESFVPILGQKNKIHKVFAFGKARNVIAKDLKDHLPLVEFSTLKELIQFLNTNPQAIDKPLLLSPACSSYDEFQNFSHRGDIFRKAVQDMELSWGLCPQAPRRGQSPQTPSGG